MLYKITVNLSVQVEKGPQYNFSPPISIDVNAYDPLITNLKPGDKDIPVEVQPGNRVSFLLIKSSIYTPPDTENDKCLTYSTEKATGINLEQPQLFLGKTAISNLLGEVKTIKFSNNLEGEAAKEPAVIEILVGRDATPSPTPAPTPTP